MSMENQEIKIENNDYIKLSRSIAVAYSENLLPFDEMVILIWLWIQANPRTGRTLTSYEGLRKNLKCRYSKNQINKIMLALKGKKLIWFPRQQGRRGSFYVDIRNYPLSTGGFKEVGEGESQNTGRSSNETPGSKNAELPAEVEPDWQKLEEEKKRLTEGFSMSSQVGYGRSHDNDNEKKNYKERSSFKNFENRNRMPINEYAPRTHEESQCLEIAKYLRERDMTFILSVLKRHGFAIIEEIYINMQEKEDSIRNRGAYFNAEVERRTKEKYT